ncbi:efflux RND transporter permease subunit [Tundrisphaera sp. TA3]|uniref:efflux RND transporter permease subunit n=1 Tax=Tundrisphaera sp. TA3 TaxID=3435775 RepID=UPI003EBC2925
MISRFFIDRPIFAAVLSIVITLAGGIALFTLPVALYPPIAPPVVQVSCTFPGASAQVVSDSVATPIEEQVNGVEGMMYMASQCTNDGGYNLTVTFKHGVDLNMAQVLVQNRVNLATPKLPDVIKQTGVTTRKKAPDILLAMALNSPDPRYDQLYLSNYALIHLKDEILRIPGVSDIGMLGQRDYSMRIWVDPEKLASRDMTASDVVAAIRRENMQVATGQIGQPPVPSGQLIQVPISLLGRLEDVEQYERIIVKKTADGRIVRVRDIAKVELGSKNEDLSCSVNGRPSMSMAIFQLPDANALETADLVKAKIEELSHSFPVGIGYEIRYDTTPFIRDSINEVFKTLREAVILVAIVVLLFLQNWRSAIIPLVAVPVAIVGTFAVMAGMGFSLNNLTLFGLVLAIGIVVDDAIVVVEAVEHHVEHGMAPRDATIRAMEEVSGPVIAIGLVLTAVFVPCAFITGIVGQFFRQFALTIATSTLISAFNSLTLSPALAALLIRPRTNTNRVALPKPAYALFGAWLAYLYLGPELAARMGPYKAGANVLAGLIGMVAGWAIGIGFDKLLVWFFGIFNRGFNLATDLYTWTVGILLRLAAVSLVGYVALLALTYVEFKRAPSGFIPSQDMGYLLCNVQLIDSTSNERTKEVMDRIEAIAKKMPGVRHTQAITGQSLLLGANGSNFGSMFCVLDPFEERPTADLYSDAIIAKLRKAFADQIPEAMVTVLGPPPVRGVGRAGGFKLMIEDRGDNGVSVLEGQTENVLDLAKKDKRLANMASTFRANVPQYFVDVNRAECMTKEVPLKDLFDTLRIYLGSLYVNDFNKFGRTWQVVVQADPQFRNAIENVKRLKVRNARGTMVPVGTLADFQQINGPLMIPRYNMYPAAPLNGAAAPGTSTGDAIAIMEKLGRENLLDSMKFEWTELAYLELQAGNTAMLVFGFAVVMVFLVLAAQYESWSMPLAIILVVPMCLLSAIIGVNLAGQDINIFTQIGFVVLVGLASKNAILIVEFAKHQRDKGISRRQATLDACRLRFRPIIMTSLAFILGVLPLLYGHGAGAEMRRTLGTTVFSGMLGVTIFGVLLTPVFFFAIDWLGETRLFGSPALQKILKFPLTILSGRLFREMIARRKRPAKRPRVDELAVPVAIQDREGELVEQK